MDEQQLDKLLSKIGRYYIQGRLDKAERKTKQALDLISTSENHISTAPLHYWLGSIYNKKATFQGEPSFYSLAIKELLQAQNILSSTPEKAIFRAGILLQLSKSYQHSGQTALANTLLNEALQLSQVLNYIGGQVSAKIEFCQLAIDQNTFTKAKRIAEEGLQLIEDKEEDSFVSIAKTTLLNLLGRIAIKRQDYIETLNISKVVLERSQKNKDVENEMVALNNLAIVHGIKSEYKEAMESLNEALLISKAIQHRQQIARCQINMGSIYAHLFNFEAALDKYQSTLQDYSDVIEDSTKVVLLNNIGNLNYDLQEIEKAQVFFQQAFDLANQSAYQELKAVSLAQLARTLRAQNETEKALEKALEAKELLEEFGVVNGAQINMINLGRIYFHLREFELSIKSLSQGIVYAKTLKDDLSEIKAYDVLSKIYLDMGNLKQAFMYLQVYTAYREEYSKVQRNRQLLDLEIKYGIQEKQQEIERLKIENDLQAKLLEQKDQIERKNEQLLEANTELKQFASIASHDLKEPLRMVSSFAKLLQRKHQASFDHASNEYLGYIIDGAVRMEKLINGLMLYATVGREEEAFQRVNLTEIIEVCCLHLRMPIEQSKASIQHKALPSFISKSSLLIQLFQNLISNAIKFRKTGSTPIIQIKSVINPSHIRLSVQDNGIGIPEKHQEQIFEMFRRLHRKDEYEGTGVGLAVCQKIAKRLGGKIWLESSIDEGSTFFVELPIMTEAVNLIDRLS